MRLRFVNPNTTASMTDKVRVAARDAAPPGVIVDAVTSARGPAAIQGEADGVAALPGLLDEVRRAVDEGVDALAIACFDDTGIMEAREAAVKAAEAASATAPIPVLGLCQAACLACLTLGHRFSIVTTLAVSVPVIEANLARSGLAGGCARVRASGVPVLALEDPDGDAAERVAEETARALREDGADAIVLGCAGMADLARRLEARFGVPVVDGVAAAARLAPFALGAARR